MLNSLIPRFRITSLSSDELERVCRAAYKAGWDYVHYSNRKHAFGVFTSRSFVPYINNDGLKEGGSFAVFPESLEYLLWEVRREVSLFDADAETYIRLGPDGHGIHGCPYHIRALLNDMEEYGSSLNRLWEELKNEFGLKD